MELLLIPEMRAYLADAGINVELRLTDASGEPLDSDLQGSLQEAIEALTQRRDRERRLAELGELGAGVTHEARNVIAGVVGLAQLSQAQTRAIRDSEPPVPLSERPDVSRAMETIARESARCVDLLNNYLSFANQGEPSAQVVSVLSLVEPVVQLTAHSAKIRRSCINIRVAPDLPSIVVRATEIREVLLNLVLNALHATGEDGLIEIVADQPSKEYLSIRVVDNGPGVPDPLKTKVFEKFFSTKPAGVGTGIGLAIAQSVVASHGGCLQLRDAEGGGAEFAVLLPIEQDVYSISERASVQR